jgi:AcrR family transcriptional regulator
MKKSKPGGARQTDIADAILRIVGREGIAVLTMERLGREVGVTSGALFRHFPSRSAMLDEAAHRAVALIETTFPAAALPPLERLRQFVVARSRLAADHPGIPQLVFSEQFGKALPPKGARAVRGVVLRTLDFLVEALREAGERGEIRRDLPAEDLAPTVIGAILAHAVFAALVDKGAGRPDAEAAWNNLLILLRPPAPASDRPPNQGPDRRASHAEMSRP